MKMRVERLQRDADGTWTFDLVRDYGAIKERDHLRTGPFGRGLAYVHTENGYRERSINGTFNVSGKSGAAVRRAIRAHFAE